ncbi:MAG: hypothetical protein ABIP06_11055 [Pyrinomonadaceae bacterium]
MSAAIVGKTTGQTATGLLQVAFWNDSGTKTATWPLTISNNNGQASCVLVNGKLIVSSQDPHTNISEVYEYSLPTDPFTSPVVEAGPKFTFGALEVDSEGHPNSRGSELIVLKSGHVACITYLHTFIAVLGAVRSKEGTWTYDGRFNFPTANLSAFSSHTFAAARCPWDDSIVCFLWSDGGVGLDVGFLRVSSAGRLELIKTIPSWINRKLISGTTEYEFGDITPNGEIPGLWAVTDEAQNRVLISLTNSYGKLLTTTDPRYRQVQNAAHPIVVAMTSDFKASAVIVAEAIVVSILHPMPIVVGPAPAVIYHTGYPYSACEMLRGSEKLAVPAFEPNLSLAVSTIRRDVVAQQPDRSVALLMFDSVPTPTPIPTPTPSPELNLAASVMVSMSWSGADPANAGKFWLQQAPAAAGPWTNVTDRWPISVQGKVAIPAYGPVVGIDSRAYYRLFPKIA